MDSHWDNEVQRKTDLLLFLVSVESHEVSVSMPSVRACLQPLMGGEVQWRQMLPVSGSTGQHWSEASVLCLAE